MVSARIFDRYDTAMPRKKKHGSIPDQTTTRIDRHTLELIQKLQADWVGTMRERLALNQTDIVRLLLRHAIAQVEEGKITLAELAIQELRDEP